jgi:flagellar hook-length control protein FliK
MRTVPHIEIRSLPAPAPQENQAQIQTSNRGDNQNFAETLKRKSATDDRADRTNKDSEPVTKPSEASEKAPTKTRQRPTDDAPSASDQATTADDLPIVDATPIDSSHVPVNPLTLGDVGIPLATTAVESADAALTAGSDVSQKQLASEIAAIANTTITSTTATDVATTGTKTADASVASATAVDTAATALNLISQAIAKSATAQTDQPVEDPAAAIASNAINADNTLVEFSSTLPNTVTAVRGPKPAALSTKIDDAQLNVSATSPSANDNELNAGLLPVFANDMVSKPALPAAKAALPSSSDDAPTTGAITALPTITPINSATPATQSTGMNAIAAAIGEKKADEKSDKSPPLEAKISNESSLVPLPSAPTPQVAATRPMSDTVLAQNVLAANGNAMEKALSHQVSKALVQNMPNGDRVLVMRLTPPELGTVKIEVIERMGVLTAKLHAEDDGVRLALERFLPSMRQDLRASDAPIRELSLSDQTQFQRSFADGQNQQQQQQQDADSSNNRRSRTDEPRFSLDGMRNETATAQRGIAPLGGRVSLSEVNALA